MILTISKMGGPLQIVVTPPDLEEDSDLFVQNLTENGEIEQIKREQLYTWIEKQMYPS